MMCNRPFAGSAQPALLSAPLLSAKVLYAAKLGEYGLVPRALAYLGLVQAHLATFGAKLPPGLIVCRTVAAELEERLRTHATVWVLTVAKCLCRHFPLLLLIPQLLASLLWNPASLGTPIMYCRLSCVLWRAVQQGAAPGVVTLTCVLCCAGAWPEHQALAERVAAGGTGAPSGQVPWFSSLCNSSMGQPVD